MMSHSNQNPSVSVCPEVATLKQMLDGTLSSTGEQRVVEHLDICTGCQVRMEQIAANNTSIIEVAKSAKLDTPPEVRSAFWPALKKVEAELLQSSIQQIKALSTSVTSELPAVGDSSTNRPRSYAFLDPAEEPEYLGQIDRFKIVELVGKGGMGMVFRAFDSCLQRTVAVKVLDPQFATNEQAQTRFCREARAAAAITHENVVTIHHVEHIEPKDLSYLVMQFVKGQSLQELLDQKGALSVREAVRIAAATASGLAAAHANGLIHRDIKPGNILIEQGTGRVLLTDFGLARLNEDVKITQTGFVAGTPLYMSPEQAKAEPLTTSSDLFSLGGVLYAMLSGNPPFQGSSAFVVLRNVTDSRHRSLHDTNPNVASAIADIVDRLLEKNPKNRYASANEVAELLTVELMKLPYTQTQSTIRRSSRFVPAVARTWWRRKSPYIAAGLVGALGLFAGLEGAKVTKYTVIGQRGLSRLSPIASTDLDDQDVKPLYEVKGSEGAVWSVTFASKTPLLASATESGVVKFYDSRDGRERGQLNNEKFKSPIWSISFNQDDSKILTASDDGHVRIWDVKSKELTFDYDNEFPVRAAVFSPDGKGLASGTRNGTLMIWNPNTDNPYPLQSIQAHPGSVIMSLAYSPDGKLVASASSDKTVRVWNVKEGTVYTTFRGHIGPVYAVAFSPDGKTLASAGWDHQVKLWDIEKREPKVSYDDSHGEDIWSLAYAPDGKHIITAGQDRTARWIDIDTGKVSMMFRGHGGPVHSVTVSPDGKLIAASGRDGSIRVWKPE